MGARACIGRKIADTQMALTMAKVRCYKWKLYKIPLLHLVPCSIYVKRVQFTWIHKTTNSCVYLHLWTVSKNNCEQGFVRVSSLEFSISFSVCDNTQPCVHALCEAWSDCSIYSKLAYTKS
jgi:hypothetical protein